MFGGKCKQSKTLKSNFTCSISGSVTDLLCMMGLNILPFSCVNSVWKAEHTPDKDYSHYLVLRKHSHAVPGPLCVQLFTSQNSPNWNLHSRLLADKTFNYND